MWGTIPSMVITKSNLSMTFIKSSTSSIPTLNLNPVINVLKEQNIILNKILDKNTDVHMDGNKVGTQLALSNPRMQ